MIDIHSKHYIQNAFSEFSQPPTPAPPTVPEGWTATWDPEKHSFFFTNPSGIIQSILPPPAIPEGWKAIWDPENSTYFFINPCGRAQNKSPEPTVPQTPPQLPVTPEGWKVTWDPEMSRYFFTSPSGKIELTVPEKGLDSKPIDQPPPPIRVGSSATWDWNNEKGWDITEGCISLQVHEALQDAIKLNTH